MRNIYEQAIAVLPAEHIDHTSYGSDLYLKKTPESAKLVAEYDFRSIVTTFVSPIDGCVWYEIPFAHTLYWEEVHRKSMQIEQRKGGRKS